MPKRSPKKAVGSDEISRDDWQPVATEGLYRAAVEIANRRAEELRKIRQALIGGDHELTIKLLHVFFGIPTKAK
jgi:hypothetical protein